MCCSSVTQCDPELSERFLVLICGLVFALGLITKSLWDYFSLRALGREASKMAATCKVQA